MDVSLSSTRHRPWSELLSLAHQADEGGLYAVYVPDHFGGYREAWTLLSALAASTERIRLGTLVLGVTHRPVSVVREMARSLQEVSDGRLVLGIGAAWDEAEHQPTSVPSPSASERLDLLDSAASQLADCGPPLLVGGGGERRTMPIAAPGMPQSGTPGLSPWPSKASACSWISSASTPVATCPPSVARPVRSS